MAKFGTELMTKSNVRFVLKIYKVILYVLIFVQMSMANSLSAESLSKKKPASRRLGLPQSVGFVGLDYRAYRLQEQYSDGLGVQRSFSSKFQKNLNAKDLSANNADLSRLVQELNNYGVNPKTGKKYGDSLSLGSVEGSASAKISATILKLAYGINRRITIFAGIPFINAEVKSDLKSKGGNNASQIKEDLGDIAFDELKDGLDQASTIGIQDVKTALRDMGYADLGTWKKSGPGDIRIGAQYGRLLNLRNQSNLDLAFTTTLIVPNGYKDKAEIMQDVGFSNEYYSFQVGVLQSLKIDSALFKSDLAYSYNNGTDTQRRLPEKSESIMDALRQTTVRLNPGQDFEGSAGLGYAFQSISADFNLGFTRHYSDRYSGSLEGNYGALGEGSDKNEIYQEFGLSYDTVADYLLGRSFYPMVLGLKRHKAMRSSNSYLNDYWQLSFTGFFG